MSGTSSTATPVTGMPVTNVDTVGVASDSPEVDQPWAALGLKSDEYARIREILDRRPTSAELAMYSVMWSEHCSYKSSKVHLRQFGDKTDDAMRQKLLVGIGENAGVVDIGDGWAVTYKVESHNHPSYIEPYQGAATGVGGIVRDIMSMGARPIAVMDVLRFGALDHPDTARVLPGVVAGVGGYGNCLGLPNIGGELEFDPCYQGNPLVNALCIGAMRVEDIHLASATGVGNLVVLFGAKTGGDGIGGVSVLASETFADGPTSSSRRPAVQVGDPFAEKVLIECCLDLYAAKVVAGIQDLGGAGLSCATSELASNGDGGMSIHLDRVPLRDSSLSPEEILMSESQERMMAVVEPEKLDDFMAIAARWDVEATVLGEVTDGTNLQVFWGEDLIVDVPPRSVAHDGPVYERPLLRPAYLDAQIADSTVGLAAPIEGPELKQALLDVLASPNGCDPTWVTQQYDRYVRGNTAQAMPDDGGVVRVDEETGRGVVVSTDCNDRFTQLDPYVGAQLSLAESYRNVAVAGGLPVAVSDCLNFGSPEDPGVMWQFERAVTGLADGCKALGIPVTGGNVSFYNQTGDVAIHPTPLVAVLGVMDDVADRHRSGWSRHPGHGEIVFLLGSTRDELDGSLWAQVAHDHLGGVPPQVDLDAEMTLAQTMTAATSAGLVRSAHDVADGGLTVALAECAMRDGVGGTIQLRDVAARDNIDAFTLFFSESGARAVVTVSAADAEAFESLCSEQSQTVARIGETGGDSLVLTDLYTATIEELRAAHTGTIEASLDS
ncbi:phosphoribosylformylglycinamidine synthase subunit PurL [soil metagenome]